MKKTSDNSYRPSNIVESESQSRLRRQHTWLVSVHYKLLFADSLVQSPDYQRGSRYELAGNLPISPSLSCLDRSLMPHRPVRMLQQLRAAISRLCSSSAGSCLGRPARRNLLTDVWLRTEYSIDISHLYYLAIANRWNDTQGEFLNIRDDC